MSLSMRLQLIYSQISEKDKCPMINIESNDFDYSNIYGMYKSKSSQGHGIQVNDYNLEKPLLKMCDKIAQAIYDYKKEIGELK